MSEMKLTYFNIQGRAEIIRMLFKLGGKSFIDDRVGEESWKKFKPTTPKGQLPVLEVNGKMLCESMAIARFVARETGLYGSNNYEAAVCDMVADTANEFSTLAGVLRRAKTDEERVEAQKKVDTSLEAFEKFVILLKKGTFILGEKASLADLFVYKVLPANNCEKYPTLDAISKSFAAIPAIVEWVKTRPVT